MGICATANSAVQNSTVQLRQKCTGTSRDARICSLTGLPSCTSALVRVPHSTTRS
eukprot:IDg985t1